MKSTENTEIVNIPENYRKAQGVEDFNIGDIVYTNLNKGTVDALVPYVRIKWDNLTYTTSYAPYQLVYLYVQDSTKQDKPNKTKFKVGDRVMFPRSYNDMKGVVYFISSCGGMMYVLWDATESSPSYVNAYTNDEQEFLIVVPKEESKELTIEESRSELLSLDLKIKVNLDTTKIETVLIDCVKATVTNGKYQEAKEICELLLSVQSLCRGKYAQSSTT